MTSARERILVIRLGALGDLIFCFRAFHAIRQAHPEADIALLTRAPFVSFAEKMPWFDRVFVDTHPTLRTPFSWLRLRRTIRTFAPDRIYDFQGKRRQSILYMLLGGPWGPAWSGAAPACRYPRPWPPAPGMSFQSFTMAQLRAAGVKDAGVPDVSWLDAPVDRFSLPSRYVVLLPGCSPQALHKRWSAEKFALLARALQKKGMACVALGTKDDALPIETLCAEAPGTINLCGKTNLFEVAGILRRAQCVIGNDTGPLHMAAALCVPTVALFSGRSNPVWSAPPGPKVLCLCRDSLEDLSVPDVLAAVGGL
ncbi:MAG: glycosyltransferase family 9 protein [Alphaproteobacteria bacterium]|nr:glycosyltransferase family 9 protein [Alphaproteobacteria bacterium]